VPQPDVSDHSRNCGEMQAQLAQTAHEARQAIEQTENLIEGFHTASHTAATLHQAADEISTLRAVIVSQIAEAENLSLSKLASRISVSKTRAAQLKRAGDQIRRRQTRQLRGE
jgi:DNA-binding XRE family transcriptional regulator